MNKPNYCFAAAFVVSTLCSGAAHAQNADLIAHYTFDDGVRDVTGNIEPLDTQTNAPTAAGKYGQALRLDGNTIVEIPIDLSADQYPDFTVSMWVKLDPPPTDSAALKAMLNYGVVASQVLGVNARKNKSPSFYAEVPGAKVSNKLHYARAGQWAHVVVTRTIEQRNTTGVVEPHVITTLYSSGRRTEKVGRLQKNTHQSSIFLGGKNRTGGTSNFVGLIDDLKIYNRVLQPAEIDGLKSAIGSQPLPGGGIKPGNSSNPVGGPLPGQAPITPGAQPVDDVEAIAGATASKDWKITALALPSKAGNELVSGNRVTLQATIARLDTTNKIPAASLSVTAVPASGGVTTIQNIPLSQPGDGTRKDYPVSIEIPSIGADGLPLSTTNVMVTSQIVYPPAAAGIDENPANNVMQASFVVNKQEDTPAEENCVQSLQENEDGTRTVQECLTGEDGEKLYYVDPNGLLVYTDIPKTVDRPGIEQGANHQRVFSHPIWRLLFSENNNKICRLRIESNSSSARLETQYKYIDVCNKKGFPNGELQHLGVLNRFVTGLRICRNSKNRRLKGIEIESKDLNSDGTLDSLSPKIERSTQTNCSQWSKWSYCPGSTVASGVKLFVRDGSSLAPQRYINTVNLLCGELQIIES